MERVFDFHLGDGGWLSGYSDYQPATAPTNVLTETCALPAPFTHPTTRISGLVPDRACRVSQRVGFLADVPAKCMGGGGAPGASGWVAAGVSSAEPLTVFDGADCRVNVDRGNHTHAIPRGAAWVLVGFHSGFGSFSGLYPQRITARLMPLA